MWTQALVIPTSSNLTRQTNFPCNNQNSLRDPRIHLQVSLVRLKYLLEKQRKPSDIQEGMFGAQLDCVLSQEIWRSRFIVTGQKQGEWMFTSQLSNEAIALENACMDHLVENRRKFKLSNPTEPALALP
jgi:hypothetical protein